MQISAGTCTVENGSAKVVASDGVDWSDALVALQYGNPVYFMLQGFSEVPRQAVAAESPNTSASGFWELTLSAPWSGDDASGAEYLIHKDFTKNLGLPIPTAGEQGWAQLLARAFEIIDTAFASQNTALPDPAADVTGAVGTTSYIRSGKTLYASGTFDVPDGVTLDIQEGATLEVG
jgi:hypothetical protein